MATRRGYSSPLRAEQSRLTRQRILAAAQELFLAKGYLGTTLAEIGEAAGVSVQSIYNSVGGKPKVLKALYDVSLAGDDEPVPMIERPKFTAMMAETDPRRLLARYAGIAREIGERTLPLVTMALAQAATGDKELKAFADTIENERTIGTRGTAGHVAERFGLRPGLDVQRAADILWTLTSPDIADRLVNRRDWGWEAYEEWLGAAMAEAILPPREA